jgi:hypothetical protein
LQLGVARKISNHNYTSGARFDRDSSNTLQLETEKLKAKE